MCFNKILLDNGCNICKPFALINGNTAINILKRYFNISADKLTKKLYWWILELQASLNVMKHDILTIEKEVETILVTYCCFINFIKEYFQV